MEYLVVVIAWSVYLALHSFLATNMVKDFVKKHLGALWPFYRFIYTLISVVGLLYLLYLIAITPSITLFVPPGYLRYIAMILASWGVIITVVSFRHLSGLAFMGLKSMDNQGLVKSGLHGHVRHPVYSGTILILIGMFLYHPTDIILVSAVCIFIYLPIGIRLEERKLIQEFGEEYEEYRREVPAIFPKLRL